ncbi:hypothetical protein BRPE64_ACDS02900 [Caballeronia insecticola]|uniref:Uncharacterized protein n=1 Tax=Caballeronia insecticola TaxID=758793 RepID=R4WF49_9BURK|nr:hypothetical protein BRPE64_ACDS02900 [Caballeronia insecticola]
MCHARNRRAVQRTRVLRAKASMIAPTAQLPATDAFLPSGRSCKKRRKCHERVVNTHANAPSGC